VSESLVSVPIKKPEDMYLFQPDPLPFPQEETSDGYSNIQAPNTSASGTRLLSPRLRILPSGKQVLIGYHSTNASKGQDNLLERCITYSQLPMTLFYSQAKVVF
jgi:hypothetical protein